MAKLTVVPTPVGNLEDMTFRAIRVLKEADLVLAEDTRTTGILFKHFEIQNKMQSHHKFNEHKTVEQLAARIKAGENIALVSDAGTPAIHSCPLEGGEGCHTIEKEFPASAGNSFFYIFLTKTLQYKKNSLSLHPQTTKGAIAQLVEQRTENPCVPGSIPGGTTTNTVSECSAVGSALRSGRRGRAFESPHSDMFKESR